MARKKRINPELIDEDSPEWTDEDFARARPLPEVLPGLMRKVRGPQRAPTKERITIRLSRDVLGQFRKSGPGWQGRLDQALRAWLKRHDPNGAHS